MTEERPPLGEHLVKIHAELREELRAVRERADRPDLVEQLRKHCLTFCGALTEHHEREDATGFAGLRRRFPDFAPVLDRLRDEHAVMADLTRDLQTAVDTGDAARIRVELDRVSADLEAHFAYEEEQLAAALNTMSSH